MTYEWDEAKAAANIAASRLGFEAIEDFERESAIVERSDGYNETRWAATGFIDNRLYRVVYTRRQDMLRVISLRRASRKEVREYATT